MRKTETIRVQQQLGQVISQTLRRLGDCGITRDQTDLLAKGAESENGGERGTTPAEMDDTVEARCAAEREEKQLVRVLEDSRKAVGIESDDLQKVVGVAL